MINAVGAGQIAASADSAWGQLPARMRVLLITGPQRTGAWLAEAFQTDSAIAVTLFEAQGAAPELALLRDEPFDAVLISHEGLDLDALALLDAIRAGGNDSQPVIVLGSASETEFAALCYEAGGDGYLCVHTTTTRCLLWRVALARERHLLLTENRKLRSVQRNHLALEHQEADRLLDQQRAMLDDLESLYSSSALSRRSNDRATALSSAARVHSSQDEALRSAPAHDDRHSAAAISQLPPLPDVLVTHYRELLRAYVIMGSGNLAGEMVKLATLLSRAGVSPHQTMRLHLKVLEEMIRGLGSRSSRHVMNRADMLILEIMINLAEEYRHQARRPPAGPLRQRWLPGMFQNNPCTAPGP